MAYRPGVVFNLRASEKLIRGAGRIANALRPTLGSTLGLVALTRSTLGGCPPSSSQPKGGSLPPTAISGDAAATALEVGTSARTE